MQDAMKMDLAMPASEPETATAAGGSLAPTAGLGRRLLLPLALGLLAAAALSIDLSVVRWASGRAYPRVVRELMSLAEGFGHGVGASLVLITVYTLDPARRKLLPRAVLVVAAAGCGANLVKLLVARQRPRAADLLPADVWSTFVGWLPLGGNRSVLQSFPSAHTATAVGLALVLSSLYPHGRRLFFVFAAAVAAQRVLGGAHYPSDVLAGALVGWLCGMAALHSVGRPLLHNHSLLRKPLTP